MIDITKKIWTIYILECGDKTLYCGITNNLERRMRQHRGEVNGGAKYTRSRKPLRVAYTEEVLTRSEALKREFIIKKMTKRDKAELANLI
ncbi:MAG: GIY-YIG nuclease family protein [Candidatus Thioglobus sp.]|nr:GIY-YIG nuclease family protein [Candidatus Pseudothioglobus aerophilus]MBT4974828.1 GIY-YIG nuclease family protein [Gammaproteobacteria bacterium]MDP0559655.1 GIY-YIG nuclease family protein [Candidatus Thioglobus sp.]